MSLRAVKSLPSLRRTIHHSAPSTTPSNLLTSPSQYNALSVAVLRVELKKRGHKVGGRKAELVERLMALDVAGRASLSSSRKVLAKGDSSTIDYYKVPPSDYHKEDYKSPFKIPVPPDARQPVKEVEATYITSVPDHGAGHTNGLATGTDDAPLVHALGDTKARTLDGGYRVNDYRSKHPEDEGPAELQSEDKTFLTVFAAAIAGWWWLGSWSKGKSTSKQT